MEFCRHLDECAAFLSVPFLVNIRREYVFTNSVVILQRLCRSVNYEMSTNLPETFYANRQTLSLINDQPDMDKNGIACRQSLLDNCLLSFFPQAFCKPADLPDAYAVQEQLIDGQDIIVQRMAFFQCTYLFENHSGLFCALGQAVFTNVLVDSRSRSNADKDR